jgi:hypothetical protein
VPGGGFEPLERTQLGGSSEQGLINLLGGAKQLRRLDGQPPQQLGC